MKNTINNIGITVAAIFLIMGMQGCGNPSENNNNNKDFKAADSLSKPTADDGQGIGKYKDIVLAEIDADHANQGRILFVERCTACHKLTDEKLIGPGLKGVTKRRKPAWIMNMITNPIEMTQKDPTAMALFQKLMVQMVFQNVDDNQTRMILDYLRQNDNDN